MAPQAQVDRPSVEEIHKVIHHPLSVDQVSFLACLVTELEIQDTLFSLARSKAPRPNGFTVEFFKKNWETIGHLITAAVLDFFATERLLREINNTLLVLVPKVLNASSVKIIGPSPVATLSTSVLPKC